MAICPAGHQTSQSDFCDTCGLPVPAQSPATMTVAPTETPSPAAAMPVICPHCQTPNVADALFCEACGYDFTTGTLPESPAAASSPVPRTTVQPEAFPDRDEPALAQAGTEPDEADPGEASPAGTESGEAGPAAADSDGGPIAPAPETESHDADMAPAEAEPTAAPVETDVPVTASPVSEAVPSEPLLVTPTARPPVEWVAELWIDPDWYTSQGSSDPMPSPSMPDIVPLVKDANLIGRVSRSRGIFPDVDCELDTGCSRRHAMLSTDGTRWWIEDLDSANGTFVGAAAGPLPGMPIPRGRVELNPGQRIYVGAWTRIVIRLATDDEKEAFGG